MKILIVDDTEANIEAAKAACTEMRDDNFIFASTATEALERLPEVDGIITDLFFLGENHQDKNSPLFLPYQDFSHEMARAGRDFDLFGSYFRDSDMNQRQSWEYVSEMINHGTFKESIKKLLRWYPEDQSYKDLLENPPAPQFPYGIVLMLEAVKQGKGRVLISDIHRHAGGFKTAQSAVDGVMLLALLIERKIITLDEAIYDGKGSRHYIGRDELERKRKTDPEPWTKAVRLVTENL